MNIPSLSFFLSSLWSGPLICLLLTVTWIWNRRIAFPGLVTYLLNLIAGKFLSHRDDGFREDKWPRMELLATREDAVVEYAFCSFQITSDLYLVADARSTKYCCRSWSCF